MNYILTDDQIECNIQHISRINHFIKTILTNVF